MTIMKIDKKKLKDKKQQQQQQQQASISGDSIKSV